MLPSTQVTAGGSGDNVMGTRSKQLPSAREIEWLQRHFSSRPDYTTFNSNHSKVLQNSERVAYWRFASNAKQDLHKKPGRPTFHPPKYDIASPLPNIIAQMLQKISGTALHMALRMASTAFSEAIQTIRIIDFYTAEGTSYSPEVAAEISKADDPNPNAGVLKAFLLQWEKAHGLVADTDAV
ncbi:hypothetical protein B0H13DRAFT_2006415 [Mycena leptocephala]|nr:hypothetical protein B0H13DRAFT_2006415 [Mycena leptocephala]